VGQGKKIYCGYKIKQNCWKLHSTILFTNLLVNLDITSGVSIEEKCMCWEKGRPEDAGGSAGLIGQRKNLFFIPF
jgi:hypothetical protein